MRKLGLLLLLLVPGFAMAAKNTNSTAAVAGEKEESKKASKKKDAEGRTHNFEDVMVQGKYLFSDEAVTTVEADKVFESLIGVRTEFKDRLEQSANKQ